MGKSDITSEQELRKYMIKELGNAIKIAAEKIQDELWNNVGNQIYSHPQGRFYDRTHEFLKSVIQPKIKVTSKSIEVTIGMNSDVMNSGFGEPGKFNQHMSLNGDTSYEGKSISEWLLIWWDDGTEQKNNPYLPELPQTNYWYEVMGDRGSKDNPEYKKFQKTFEDIVTQELSKIGQVNKI